MDLEGHIGPILRHSSSRVMRSGWTWEVELQWLGSRVLVGGGGIKLSLSQCGSQESLVEEKLTILKAIPDVFLFSPYGLPGLVGMIDGSIRGPLHLAHVQCLRQQTLLPSRYQRLLDVFSLLQLCIFSYLLCPHLGVPKASQTQPVQDRTDHDFM